MALASIITNKKSTEVACILLIQYFFIGFKAYFIMYQYTKSCLKTFLRNMMK